MKSALVVDSNKISLLMSAETCKDVKTDKVEVEVAYSGMECLKKIQEKNYDFIVVDFDLSDCDGVTLIKEIKKVYSGPTFLTAFPDPAVIEGINRELYWYEDVNKWLKKPLNPSELRSLIDHFVFKKNRVAKRFAPNVSANIAYEKSDKKVEMSGKVLSMTIHTIAVKYSKKRKFKKEENLVLRIFPEAKDKNIPEKGILVKGTVEWVNPESNEIGLSLQNIPNTTRKTIEKLLKNSLYLEEALVV